MSLSGAYTSRGVQSIRAPKSNKIAGSLLPGAWRNKQSIFGPADRGEDAHINHPACRGQAPLPGLLPVGEPGGLKVRFHSCPQLLVMKIAVMKVPTRVVVIQEGSWNRSVQRALKRTGSYCLFDTAPTSPVDHDGFS